ncbi:FAD-dependent monooxygenase [Kribbella sp. NPDC004875]|uniref:FAD-dependent monooxygenase n=1 Tax=Kribbella sp. NPDC004875 TaxID=3364107 RepID=UPI00368FD2C6
MRTPRVLVVGAGPTGLALALQAHALGAEVRIVDRRPEAARPSRAMMVHSRTLEVLRPLGVVEPLLRHAVTAPTVQLHLHGHTVRVALSEFAVPDTPYPHLTLTRQGDVEAVLTSALAERGVSVERGVELAGLPTTPYAAVRAELRGTDSGTADCDYLVGCDGADSTVRRLTEISSTGADYRQEIVLADVELEGELQLDSAHVAPGWSGLVFLFPRGDVATWRLMATRPLSGTPAGESVSPAVAQSILDTARLPARISRLAWSSVLRLRHRLADSYRSDRIFLAGDAAHVHSPAGGQGMNTGIQDAVNLGWKLACAGAERPAGGLLDSYEQERRSVARTTIGVTNLVFWAESGLDPFASLTRAVLVPLGAPVLPAALRCRQLAAEGFRTLAQLRVGYPRSPLSVDDGPAGALRVGAGDRLPDLPVTVAAGRTRLQTLTARPGFHLLLLRDAAEPERPAKRAPIHVHRLLDQRGRGVIGVRPDGYVGLRSTDGSAAQLDRWLALAGA